MTTLSETERARVYFSRSGIRGAWNVWELVSATGLYIVNPVGSFGRAVALQPALEARLIPVTCSALKEVVKGRARDDLSNRLCRIGGHSARLEVWFTVAEIVRTLWVVRYDDPHAPVDDAKWIYAVTELLPHTR